MCYCDDDDDVHVTDWFQRVMLLTWLNALPRSKPTAEACLYLHSLPPAACVNDLRGRNIKIWQLLPQAVPNQFPVTESSETPIPARIAQEVAHEVVSEACSGWMPRHFLREGCCCADYAIKAMHGAMWAARTLIREQLAISWNTSGSNMSSEAMRKFAWARLQLTLARLEGGPSREWRREPVVMHERQAHA